MRLLALLLTLSASPLFAQAPVDSALAAYIATIRAIDAHAHPMRPVPPVATCNRNGCPLRLSP